MMEELRIDDEERKERTQLRAAFWQVNDMTAGCEEEMILISRLAVRGVEGILMALTNLASRSTDRNLNQAPKNVRCD